MEPSEAWIGKVMFIGLVALAIWGVTALLKAKGEVARRGRVVAGGMLALFIATVVGMMAGPVGLVVVLAIVAAITWVIKGAKK